MKVQRLVFPRQLALACAISSAAVLFFGPADEARAQVDLNLQSRIDTFSPPLSVKPLPPPETKPGTYCNALRPDCPPIDAAEANRLLAGAIRSINTRIGAALGPAKTIETLKSLRPTKTAEAQARDWLTACAGKLDSGQDLAACLTNRLRELQQKSVAVLRATLLQLTTKRKLLTLALPVSPINFKATTAQPTKFTILLPFNPTYESNVLKSNQNVNSDTSFGFGGGVQLVTAGARPFDLIALSAGTASARYAAFPSKSLDTVTAQGAYQYFIGASAYRADGSSFDPARPNQTAPVANMTTVETVAFGFQNATAYVPTFHRETADLFTPQITLARQNMLVGSAKPCRTSATSDANKDGFCHYLDLSLTLGQTFSDQIVQQNASIAGAANLGWRIDETDFKLALQTVATARAYTNFAGGRQDVLLQTGPVLTYSPAPVPGAPVFNFAVSIIYNRNFSSLSAAEWNGVVIQPTLTIGFPVIPPTL